MRTRRALALLALLSVVLPAGVTAQTPTHAAIRRALPSLQTSAAAFVAQRACVSCHHNALAVLTLRQARQQGFDVDTAVLDAVEAKTFRELRTSSALDDAVGGLQVSDPTPNDSYLLMAAQAAGVGASSVTGVYAKRIAAWQRDGRWITSDFRPPHSSSVFTATATALRALRFYLPVELVAEREAAFARARQWLSATQPQSTEDASFRVMGLVWADASSPDRQAAVRGLLAAQRADGGWAQLDGYPSDAYSTGEALVALHEAGVPSSDAARVRGVKFLISTQARDGTWRVRTRMISPATVSPPYFKTGFPYDKDEFLSYAGSCWAVMALTSTLAASPSVSAAPRLQEDVPTWIRTALFGSARELTALLDGGLDPNSRTERGTSVLMMAASDPAKVRELLARGADVRHRGTSGADAVSIASTYYGSSPSLRLLFDAGAPADAPEGVTIRRSALASAAMSGDVEAVSLLLEHGATASVEALSEAVTFGHAAVVQRLVEAGVSVRITESTGVNLLHWATITNRAAVIPVLAKAGVPIDAVDDFGFTPLMYAATIDHGDTATLEALLAAGADRRVRNAEGRTPLAQAQRLRHARAAAKLR